MTENFLETIDKHALLKKQFIRGNKTPFMNRDFQKVIYTRTRLKINIGKIRLEKMS